MKKKNLLFLSLTLLLAGCNANSNSISNSNYPSTSTSSSANQTKVYPSIITPNGTPTIAISNYAINHMDDVEVVSGPQPLAAAFASGDKDIIIAPINLGAMRYNKETNPTYGLYRTIVWDNIYLLSRKEVKTIDDLRGKTVTSYGKGSTPDIILNTVISSTNLSNDITIEYVDNVVMANSAFSSGTADYVISAQPNISALNLEGVYVKPLLDFWKTATGLDSYPQSAMFVKISKYEELKPALKEIDASIELVTKDVGTTAKNAETVTGTFKEALLAKAIPNCGYKSFKNEKELVEGYFNAMINLGLSANVGGKLPNENFYLNK